VSIKSSVRNPKFIIVLGAIVALVMFAFLNAPFGVLRAGVAALCAFLLAAVVPLYQSFAAGAQLEIAKRQEAREQARDVEAAAAADLQLQFWLESPGPRPLALPTLLRRTNENVDLAFTVFLRNAGSVENASASHIEILIPILVTTVSLVGKEVGNVALSFTELHGERFARISANCSTKVQPGTTVPVASIQLVGARESLTPPIRTEALWRVTSGAAIAPAPNDYGRIPIGLAYADGRPSSKDVEPRSNEQPSQVEFVRALEARLAGLSDRAQDSRRGRKVEEWQAVRMIAMLSRYPKQKVVLLASRGDETEGYAKALREIFLTSGWAVKGPLPAPIDQAAIDLQVSISANAEHWGGAIPEPYTSLRAAIDFVGLKSRMKFIFDPDVPADVVVLWIGAESPPNMNAQNYVPLAIGRAIEPNGFLTAADQKVTGS